MGRNKRSIIFIVEWVMVLMVGVSVVSAASDYPNRYIDLIIPYGPGGATDVASRLFKDKVEQILGQPIVFSYKPGATGAVGALYAKGSKPDGYTLLMVSTTTLILPPLTRKGADYTMEDFAPVCGITYIPQIFCVKEDSPYKTMADFIQAAKTKRMKYSTVGAMGISHICMEALSRGAGFQAIHVPYTTGGAAAMTAVLGGHVDMSVCGPTGMEQQLRILAVAQQKRWALHPEVPTLKELGYPISGEAYFSFWAPKGIPKGISDKIYGAHKKVLGENKEDITKRANAANQIVSLLDSEELGKISRDSNEFFKKMIERIGGPIK